MLRFQRRSAQELSRSRANADSDFNAARTISNTTSDADTIFTWRARRSPNAEADSVFTGRADRSPDAETNSNAKEEMAAKETRHTDAGSDYSVKVTDDGAGF